MAVKIFFCYAHEDEQLLNRLKTYLKPFQHHGLIDIWHDRDISAGKEWEREISKHLNEAQIILLLVSPDFMNSDYCYGVEMQRAIERHEREEARVIPIILRPIHWQGTLGKLQALPTDAKPIIDRYWHTIDEAFYNVAEGIRKVSEEVVAKPAPVITKTVQKQDRDQSDKFTEEARKVLSLAEVEAQGFQHNYIGTEHLLLGLVREGEGVAAKVLSKLGVELNKVRSAVEFIIGRGDRIALDEINLTPRAKKVIQLAADEGRRMNHHYIGTEHLLLGLIREGEGIAWGVLDGLGVTLTGARIQTMKVLNQRS